MSSSVVAIALYTDDHKCYYFHLVDATDWQKIENQLSRLWSQDMQKAWFADGLDCSPVLILNNCTTVSLYQLKQQLSVYYNPYGTTGKLDKIKNYYKDIIEQHNETLLAKNIIGTFNLVTALKLFLLSTA